MKKYLDAKVIEMVDRFTVIINKGIRDGVENGDIAYAVYKFNLQDNSLELGEVSLNIFKLKVIDVFEKFSFCESDEDEYMGTFNDVMPVQKSFLPVNDQQQFIVDNQSYKNITIGTDIELYKVEK
ncbi:hypothetical protein [Solobacterium moorei]|uniref:Uncharacterized protein n=1 Tax=Solobacterium moorei TaxID=102148 RepID=A0A412PD28_9FIRM|nr:hypothetical protein [Solobacterium moorei]RGT55088.1 hypothetical protein DWX20_08005 [Solobacterium moorei]